MKVIHTGEHGCEVIRKQTLFHCMYNDLACLASPTCDMDFPLDKLSLHSSWDISDLH